MEASTNFYLLKNNSPLEGMVDGGLVLNLSLLCSLPFLIEIIVLVIILRFVIFKFGMKDLVIQASKL